MKKIDNLNRSITRTKIKSVIKTLSTNRCPGPNSLSGNSIKHKEELYQSFSNYSGKLKKKHCKFILRPPLP